MILHLLPADGGYRDPGRLRHAAVYGHGDVAGYLVGQAEMPLSRGRGDYTARDRSLRGRLKDRKRTNQEREQTLVLKVPV